MTPPAQQNKELHVEKGALFSLPPTDTFPVTAGLLTDDGYQRVRQGPLDGLRSQEGRGRIRVLEALL